MPGHDGAEPDPEEEVPPVALAVVPANPKLAALKTEIDAIVARLNAAIVDVMAAIGGVKADLIKVTDTFISLEIQQTMLFLRKRESVPGRRSPPTP
jgi:hypothetical protein